MTRNAILLLSLPSPRPSHMRHLHLSSKRISSNGRSDVLLQGGRRRLPDDGDGLPPCAVQCITEHLGHGRRRLPDGRCGPGVSERWSRGGWAEESMIRTSGVGVRTVLVAASWHRRLQMCIERRVGSNSNCDTACSACNCSTEAEYRVTMFRCGQEGHRKWHRFASGGISQSAWQPGIVAWKTQRMIAWVCICGRGAGVVGWRERVDGGLGRSRGGIHEGNTLVTSRRSRKARS